MSPVVSTKTAFKIMSLYVIASLLLAACGATKKHRTGIKVLGGEVIAKESKTQENLPGTGAKAKEMEYAFLSAIESEEALVRTILTQYDQKTLEAAKAASEQVQNISLVRTADGTEIRMTIANKDSKVAPEIRRIKLSETKGDGNLSSLKGEDSDFSAQVRCVMAACNTGVGELNRKADGVRIPLLVKVLDAKPVYRGGTLPRNSDTEGDFVADAKKVKRHFLVSMIETPNRLAVITNTVNLVTGESQMMAALASDALDGKLRTLEIGGPLFKIQKGKESVGLTSTLNPDRVSQVERRDLKADGVMTFAVILDPGKPVVNAATAATSKTATVIFDLIPTLAGSSR